VADRIELGGDSLMGGHCLAGPTSWIRQFWSGPRRPAGSRSRLLGACRADRAGRRRVEEWLASSFARGFASGRLARCERERLCSILDEHAPDLDVSAQRGQSCREC